MVRRKPYLLFTAFFLAILLSFAGSSVSKGETLTGSLTNELTLTPQTPTINAFTSELNVDYSFDGLMFSSVSTFNKTSFEEQKFEVTGSINLFDFGSELTFDPTSTDTFESWRGDFSVTSGGLYLTDELLLKNLDDGYGSGMELSFGGEMNGNGSIDVTSYFGMDEDENITGKSELGYELTKVQVSGIEFGDCCTLDNTTYIGQKDAFDPDTVAFKSTFETTINHPTWPLSLDTDVEFTPQTKSVTLEPELDTTWSCFEVFTELETQSSGSKLTSIKLKGFGMSDLELGPVSLTGYTALNDYNVNDLDDDFIGEYDYVTSSKSVTLDEVLRIETTNHLDLTMDTYFDMSGSTDAALDLALFHGTATYEMSDQFDIGSQMYLVTDSGLDKLEVSFDYYF